MRKKLDFFYFEAGGGHRAAAQALKQVCQEQGRDWDVQLVNLQQLLIELDIARKWFNIRMEDVYNLLLKKGWTLGMDYMKAVLTAVVRRYHDDEVRELSKYFAARCPDLVVSLIPNFNAALYEALSHTLPGTPYATILTDLADSPPNFWIERGQRQYFICGTARAAGQARELGHPAGRIFVVSGMILNPRFYRPLELDRACERRRLGLDAEQPTALVLFGGEGSPSMVRIARKLNRASLPMQAVYICGRNKKLREHLLATQHTMPVVVEGFTSEIPYYMYLSDFFIGKPGPGSISEAVAMKLPVIVERNAWTMPQERYNADWVTENGLGLVVRSFSQIAEAVEEMLRPERLAQYRAAAAAQQNRAVYEIPDLLERIMHDD